MRRGVLVVTVRCMCPSLMDVDSATTSTNPNLMLNLVEPKCLFVVLQL
jgi:hypothetical protein